ncbi:hypothetical protein niasHS_012958 [Heterodera schachtii]|uniref:JmjC domain-containing protein n=1 Tax=Heterodera schachtii TaxID=97005 RepID=A0ABD2IKG7_HETSC
MVAKQNAWIKSKPPEDAFVIRGICAPIGTSAFCMHREEEHSYHLNFNFGPSPKLWFFVAAELEGKVRELGQRLFGAQWAKCANPLGHISYLFSPAQFRDAGIPFEMQLQKPGEAILTVGLHSGINLGPSVCLVAEFQSPRSVARFKEVGKWTRCKCKNRQAYRFTKQQETEYLQLTQSMVASERAAMAWRKHDGSGKRQKPDANRLAELAARKREQRARQKKEGHVPQKKIKENDTIVNLDDLDLD